MVELSLGDALEELIDHRGKTPLKLGSTFTEDGVPVVSAIMVKDGCLNLDDARYVSESIARKWMPVSVRHGDVLLTSEAPLGRVARVTSDRPLVLGQRIFGLRGKDGILDSGFLFYALQTSQLQAAMQGLSTGSTVSGIRQSALRGLVIHAPDYPEQQAISAVLGSLDDTIAANGRISTAAFGLAAQIALGLMRRSATGTPTVVRDLGQIYDGPHATPTRGDGNGPYFLNISSLKSGRLDLAESDRLSEEDFTKWTRRVTPLENDLLFSYETRLGEAALMPGDIRACLGRRMALLSPNLDRVDPHFLLHFYLSPGFQRTISMHTIHGATVPRIGLAKMGDWEVALPSIEDQRSIAGQLKSLHDLTLQAERESASLASARDQLLPLLMAGKLSVKGAESLVEEVV